MAPAIPDRWIPYKPFGSVIEGTRLICFKVPLRKSVQEDCRRQGIKIEEIWDIETLLENIPNLSIVIDLTNTARYYDPRVFEAAGVQHVKICLPGRTMPPEQSVTQFCDTVERFLQNNADGLVGVHCTHGLNRTGYMVCRYLRDRLGIPAEKAIEIFESARGYKIERENYLAGIRGKEVPPPEFGNDTVLMPIEEESGRYVRRRRDNRSNGYRRERDGTHGDTSRSRDRSPLRERESGTRRRHNNGNTRDMQREKRRRHDDEYDYRYDY